MSAPPLWPVVDADELLGPVIELCLARPDLAQKILNSVARDKRANKVASFYDHIFEVAPRSALGTKNYIAAIRPRSAEHIDLALRALDASEVVRDSHGVFSNKDAS